MATYQIPQFLDSGEKIFGSMNIRQFAYFLVGMGISVVIWTITNNAFPILGPYSILSAAPAMLIFAYLSLGKFNGRDSEIYVLKAIIYYTKPRILKFKKDVDTADLDAQEKEWTVEKVKARWSQTQELDTSESVNTQTSQMATRIQQIRNLAKTVDDISGSVGTTVTGLEKKRDILTNTITKIEATTKKPARFLPLTKKK